MTLGRAYPEATTGGVDVENEGSTVNTATKLNFVGPGVTATDAGGGEVTVDIPGGGSPDASTTVKGIVELATVAETQAGTDTVRAVTPGSVADIVLPAGGSTGQVLAKSSGTDYDANWATGGVGTGIDIEDEGSTVNTATKLNFVGPGVTATDAGGGETTVDIPGGGSVIPSTIEINSTAELEALATADVVTLTQDTHFDIKTSITSATRFELDGFKLSIQAHSKAGFVWTFTGVGTYFVSSSFGGGFGMFGVTQLLFSAGGKFLNIPGSGVFTSAVDINNCLVVGCAELGPLTDLFLRMKDSVFFFTSAGFTLFDCGYVTANVGLNNPAATTPFIDYAAPSILPPGVPLIEMTSTGGSNFDQPVIRIDPGVADNTRQLYAVSTYASENFFDTSGGRTGTFTDVADATVALTAITSVTDSGGTARFNYTVGPTLFIHQQVEISGYITNPAYNGSFIIAAVGPGFFEIKLLLFGSDEAGGSFTSDSVTITIPPAVIVPTSFSIAGQDTSPTSIAFKPDGLKMFMLGALTNIVYEYDLSIPGEEESAVYNGAFFYVGDQDTGPTGLAFKDDDGTKMFIVGTTTDAVYEYDLSSGWSVLSAVYNGASFSVASQDTEPLALAFKNDDGAKMFIAGNITNTLYEYDLSSGWSVLSAAYNGAFLIVTGQDTAPQGMAFKDDDGAKLFMVGTTSDKVHEYDLGIGWSLLSAAYNDISFSVAGQDGLPLGIAFKDGGAKMFMVGAATDTVYGYDMHTEWALNSLNMDLVDGSTFVLDTNASTDYDAGATAYNVIAINDTLQTNRAFTTTHSGTWDTSGLDQTDPRVVSLGITLVKNSKYIASAFVNNNSTANGAIVNNIFTSMVFGTAGAALVQSSTIERWKLIDDVNGVFEYTGNEPFSDAIVFDFTVVSSGGTVDFRFKWEIDTGGGFVDMPDPVEALVAVGSDSQSVSKKFPLSAIKGDRIRPRITRNSGSSTITTTYSSIFAGG